MSEPFLLRPGMSCPCGSPELRIIAPGGEPTIEAGIVLERGTSMRAWCGPACAAAAGWPWLRSERDPVPIAGQLDLFGAPA
jgi:hypothetical protein